MSGETHDSDRLVKVCRYLNESGARYLVCGAYAMILHRSIRATEDVDILIEKAEDNYGRVIAALSRLPDGAAAELTLADFAENVVIKVADEIEVDVSTQAWTVTYAEAVRSAERTVVDGVEIPYLSKADLIRSKQTFREQDRVDVERLKRLSD